MGDDAVKRELWDGKIPVCFKLDEDDVAMTIRGDRVAPEPCYMMLPRVCFFPLLYEKLEKLYARAAGKQTEDELWLSAEATPLKWHYPVGVLYDLYGRGMNLPWEITVHFRNFPEDTVLHCQTRDALEAHFKSRLKEADCVKHKSEVIQSLTPQEFGQIWKGFSENNYDEFWAVNKKMMLSTRSEREPFKNIPFCIYQISPCIIRHCSSLLVFQDGKAVFQRLLTPYKSKSTPAGGGDLVENTLGDVLQLYSSSFPISQEHCVLIHGIEISPQTPIQWLSENLSYPDSFLHICVVHK
jgi:autophagy-related protein 5